MGLRSTTLSLIACGVALCAIALPGVAPYALAQSQGASPAAKPPYNIIFVISDQEAEHLLVTSNDYELPARAELQRRGINLSQSLHRIGHVYAVAGRLLQWSAAAGQWRL